MHTPFCRYLYIIGCLLALVACSSSSQQAIVYQRDGQIWAMNPDGTQQHALIPTNVRAGGPRWSPDGRKVSFTAIMPDGTTSIWIADSNGANPHQVSPNFDSINAIWLNQNMLVTQVVTDTGRASNNPQTHYILDLRDGTLHEYSSGPEEVVTLPDGKRWLGWNPVSGIITLYEINAKSQPLFPGYVFSGPTAFDVSPTGEEIVFQGRRNESAGSELAYKIYRARISPDVQSEPQEILPFDCCAEIHWSPDGKWIALLDQTNQIHIIDAGTNTVKTSFRPGFLTKSGGTFQWSPDSQWLLVESMNYGTPGAGNILELAKIDMQTGTVTRLTNNDSTEFSPDWGVIR